MAAFGAIWIPLVAVYHVVRILMKSPQDFMLLFKPYGLEEHQLRPQDVGQRSLDHVFGTGEYPQATVSRMEQYKTEQSPHEAKYASDNPAYDEEFKKTKL